MALEEEKLLSGSLGKPTRMLDMAGVFIACLPSYAFACNRDATLGVVKSGAGHVQSWRPNTEVRS